MLQPIINKALVLLKQEGLRKTAAWFLKSLVMPQRFIVLEYNLRGTLPAIQISWDLEVRQVTREELKKFKQSSPSLPVEFFYDEIYGLSTCFLTFVHGEVARVVWLSLPGEFNRHFTLMPGEAELFQVYVLPKFRLLGINHKTYLYHLKWLKDHGYHRVYARVESSMRAWRQKMEQFGYERIGAITHFAFYCPKFRKRDGVA